MMSTHRFPRGLSMADFEGYAEAQGWKYPKHAGELNPQGDYYCTVCASVDPFKHNEETHKDFNEWKKEAEKT